MRRFLIHSWNISIIFLVVGGQETHMTPTCTSWVINYMSQKSPLIFMLEGLCINTRALLRLERTMNSLCH